MQQSAADACAHALPQHCLRLGNYNSAMMVVGGLNNIAVSRLKDTWEGVPKRDMDAWISATAVLESRNNYSRYREHLMSNSMSIIPFLGMLPASQCRS